MTATFQIGKKHVGPVEPVFIIAEAGVNHNGDIVLARQLVDVAALAGADAIKFQTFTAELVVTDSAAQADYQARNTGKTESQLAMLKRLELSREAHRELVEYCRSKDIIFLSTPFSEPDADFLLELGVPAFKIPSGEITNLPFLQHTAHFGKPLLISTGMSDLAEVLCAVETVRAAGACEIAVLHSTSNYPPTSQGMNLRAIMTLANALKPLGISIGYSDNGSPGVYAEVIATALGACIIEKHFTLDRQLPGPDQRASLEPAEFTEMVRAIRETERMLGDGNKRVMPEEQPIQLIARRSIVARHALALGAVIAREDLIMKRPGTGLPPTALATVVGKKTRVPISADTLIDPDWLYE